jgi:5'-3' exonuclease
MFDKKFLNQIITSLGNDKPTRNSRVLVVDSMNAFIRSFSTINLMNPAGHHIGGLVGYLRTVGYAIKTFRPTRVILVFDGLGSTNNKKNLYPEYKGNRNITRITNWDMFDNKVDESQAMVDQMTRLIQYLQQLPVTLVSIDKIEADDSIGLIADHFEKDPLCNEVTIMSADKDFYQLISDKTSVYSPTKKKTYKTSDILEEFNVHPNNFLIYKTLLGDASDNLPGIKGMGPKKIVKLFPLANVEEYNLKDIYSMSEDNIDTNHMYKSILEAKHQLDINYQLMNLREPNISEENTTEIYRLLNEEITHLNLGGFMVLYESDGLQNAIGNTHSWLSDVFGALILK